MISIKSTKTLSIDGVKLLVYGHAGAGKTSLIKTLPTPIVLSSEAGLLSLQDANLPYIEVKSHDELKECYIWLTKSDEAKQFKTVAVDSISEIAEVVLAAELKKTKDGRTAYGELNMVMANIIRTFRDLPDRHVYMTAKLEKAQDEMGKILYAPSMPGKTLSMQLPYYFDEVFALRTEKNNEGKTERMLQCDSDGIWIAKDRSGKLGQWHAPDLGSVIDTISVPRETIQGKK